MKTKLVTAALLFSVFSVQSSAQSESELKSDTDTIASVVAGVVDFYRPLKGKEISINGYIGTFAGDTVYYVDETGRYDVALDAGRDVRRQIEGCEINLFDINDSDCSLTGMAEISIDINEVDAADGIDMDLILFRVDSFDKKSG